MGYSLTTESEPGIAPTRPTPVKKAFSRRPRNRREFAESPFGDTVVATGPLAKANPFRFSTKYFVDELGMGDWGCRWYGPSLARWLSRDPIGERGGINLYGYTANNCITRFDALGCDWWEFLWATPIFGNILAGLGDPNGIYPVEYSIYKNTEYTSDAKHICERQIEIAAAKHASDYANSGIVQFGVDAIIAGLGTLGGPPGWIVSSGFIIDGFVRAYITTHKLSKIETAAIAAKLEYCKECP